MHTYIVLLLLWTLSYTAKWYLREGVNVSVYWLRRTSKLQIREREHKPSSVFPGSRQLSRHLRSIKQLQFSGQRIREERHPFEEFWRYEQDFLRCLAQRVNCLKASDGLRNSWQESWPRNLLVKKKKISIPTLRLWANQPACGIFHPQCLNPFPYYKT